MRRPFRPRAARAAALLVALGFVAACASLRPKEKAPDERFGHRYAGEAFDGRRTVSIAPPGPADRFFVYPAVLDSVHVRHAPLAPDSLDRPVPVEVLFKGSFPDACTELHRLEQSRTGHLINLTLDMRRPHGALCSSLKLPYRFYTLLEDSLVPGHYTLIVNNSATTTFPFEIRD